MDDTALRVNVIEEYMDVLNVADHLCIPLHQDLLNIKNYRWYERLEIE